MSVATSQKQSRPEGSGPQSKADLMRRKRARDNDLKPLRIKDIGRRLQLEADDVEWLRFYLGHVYVNPLSEDRLENIQQMRYCAKYGVRKCIAAPRGGGKTTDARGILLKDALAGSLLSAFLVSASGGKATESENAIRNAVEAAQPGEPLYDDYPFQCAVIQFVARAPSRANNATARGWAIHTKWSHGDAMVWPSIRDPEADADELWNDWRITRNKLGAILCSCGITSSMLQGSNVLDVRTQILVLDDVDDRESAELDKGSMLKKNRAIIDKTIAGMGGQGKPFGQIMLCTVPSVTSVAFLYSDPQVYPAWDGVRLLRLKTWPANMALWDTYVELKHEGSQKFDENKRPVDKFGRTAHQHYLDNREEMDRGAVVYDEYDFDGSLLPDGSQKQVSALQKCFDYIADVGLESFNTEHQQDPPRLPEQFEVHVSPYHVSTCDSDLLKDHVKVASRLVVRAADIRKTEIHDVTLSVDDEANHRIVDYRERGHGTPSNTVEQAEQLIFDGLHSMVADWLENPLVDANGTEHSTDLVLIDKGWMGSWKTEDGQIKTWASQPVERFCIEMGLRNYMPAKGAPHYQSPAPDRDTIVGDNWHINRGVGKDRKCSEVIWSAMHWHLLVEELFMLDVDDPDRFVLFDAEQAGGYYARHRRFGEHILAGATEMKATMKRGSQSRKPRFVKDHWWDALAMALVAKSVETELALRQTRKRPTMSLGQMAAANKRK